MRSLADILADMADNPETAERYREALAEASNKLQTLAEVAERVIDSCAADSVEGRKGRAA